MNGSRSHSSRYGSGDSSLDALNRTIEGLEARIEDMLGRGGQPGKAANAARPAPAGAGSDMLDGIRARQRALENIQRGPVHSAVKPQAPNFFAQQPAAAAAPARPAAPTPAPRTDLSEALVKEMAALRREMSELRTEARDQALPQDLRRDLAGISASIDALGAQDSGADSLRLELDSMRSMIDRLAREDSVQSLESRWQAMEEQVSGLDVGGLREELVNLAYRLDDIREALATMPATGQVQAIEDKIAELAQAIEIMTTQPAEFGAEFPQLFDQLGARLDEITRAIAAIPAPPTPVVDTAPFDRLEARLASVAQKIDQLQLEPAETTSDIGARIEHLAARVAELADEEAVARLDARIERLQTLVEDGARGDRMPELSEYLSDISNKIEALDARGVDPSVLARLDNLADQIENFAATPHQPAAVPEAVIGRLEALIGRAEATASRSVDPLPGLETLDARLADIAAKLQQAEVTAAGYAMQPAGGLENVEAQLAEIAARLDRAPAEQAHVTIPGIENLEARLADIADRLDMSSNAVAGPSDEAIRGLEDQIANLSRLVSSAPSSAASEAFDDRFASLEEHLATSDEFIVEAARQAAEAALMAYSGQMGGAPSAQSIANIEVITALADDLKALEGLSRKSDDRTMRAFEAVQDTLLKIAGRLEKLDMGQISGGSVGLAGMRDAVADARTAVEAAMPSASTDALDHAMQSADGSGEEGRYQAGAHKIAGQGEHTDRVPHSPAEAAARAAAFATSEEMGQHSGALDAAGKSDGKSFLSGLAARIRPGKEAPTPVAAEPQFTETNTPPLDPSMELDAATANMPLEPGSGAPDINRILQKVREAQAVERQRGGAADDGSEKSEFLASARRAAMAAAAEVETIGKGRKAGKASGGLRDVLKSRRRPILMAAGAVLLAIMSFPLVTGMLSGGSDDQAAVEPAIVEPAAPVEQLAAPLSAESGEADIENPQQLAEARLPEVRRIEPGKDPLVSDTSVTDTPVAVSSEETAAIAPAASPAPAVQVENNDASVLMAELDALPEGAAPAALKAAAAAGNPLAFYEIGARFTDGRGVAVDLSRAATWYQRAADLGHAPSQYRIANFYEKGSGVDRDLAAAKKWYQMAAEQGNASAMHNLAVLYATAGQAPDFDNAAEWFGRAADVGVRDSQVNLAILYARGDGVTRDLVQSYKWFAIAANDGDKDAAVKRDEVFNALRPEQAEAARAAVANWTAKPISPEANAVEVPATWGGDSTETAAVDMGKAIRNIQAILNNNGFDAGKADGMMGKKTISAIKAFQSSIGMEPTGEITDALVKELLARNG
ncbi:peptidoglycan-binding protein [Hoeflea sp. G2-23]|uniref:Peptidoglycan-binding protein n=1 Tax=Hoeflea algicola TaxID=2983763 RepID=A0ABT3ZDH7_9HYPH|nr:peptidoglycan-binding protein [Hoeflea algicola]MCY0149789.1 peptidoglycan-binding protein [Hoeflea algicola]